MLIQKPFSPALPRLAVAVTLFTLGLGACGGQGASGRQRTPGGALWVPAGSGAIAAEGLLQLREADVQELFLESGRIAGTPEAPRVERGAWPDLPTGATISVVLRGAAPPPGTDFGLAAQALVAELEALRRDADGRRWLTVGLHLQLTSSGEPDADAALGEFLAEVRDRLDPTQFLSLGLETADIARESLLEAAEPVDFVVAWLYGQSLESRDEAKAWDPDRVLADLDRLEKAELDHLLGLRTVPRLEVLGSDGRVRDTSSRGSLRAFVDRAELVRQADDVFSGAGRVVYTFRARRPAEAAGMSARAGEDFRVVRTTPGVVQDLLNRVSARNPRGYLGPVVDRLAREGESLALSLDDVVTAFGNGPVAPKLTPRVVVKSRRSDTWVLEVVLANEGRRDTDLAATDWNYLQIRVAGGYIGRVVPGSFSRYRLWLEEQEVRAGIGAWREPDEVRLYTPLVEGGDMLRAEIEVRSRSSAPTLTLGGSFVLPEGRILELTPWSGSLQQVPQR
jgi:hypothetical protein